MPSQDWILTHIGLEMSDEWRPPGAPADDPPGWVWWIPQEPAWSSWIQHYHDLGRTVRATTVAFFVCLGAALTSPVTGWVVGIIGITAAFEVGTFLLSLRVSLRHFARDPLGELRDHHNHVAERLSEGAVIGDRPSLGLVDWCDIDVGGGGGFFDD